MGCGASLEPPPVRTSVRIYPGSKGPPKEEGADPATFKGPRSDTPHNVQAPTENLDGEEQIQHQVIPEPIVLAEEELFKRTSENQDIILDDGESVSGAEPDLELTIKEVNAQHSAFGREEYWLHARQSEYVATSITRPEVDAGELWTDPDYPKSVAMRGIKESVLWKRPKSFIKAPCLYADDTCRYDIGQGSAGTCWFLAVLASLADQPEYLKYIIPEGSYRIGTPEYDGIFHCRFWRFGDWVDVYVDDNIPVEDGKPWGASSTTSPNELWVTLMEKAFSKLHGGYTRVNGGSPHDAFTTLTAGTSEVMWLKDTTPKEFYRRAKNILASGSILAASSNAGRDVRGLASSHAYSITAVCKVLYRSKYVSLMRIRNPWGERDGEWNGPWSDRSGEWSQLSAKDQAAIQHTPGADGEFWMSFTDFFNRFLCVSICNYTPDVDLDGTTDDMNKTWVISSEWKGENAAGLKNKMKNPKFEFEIPQKDIPKEGTPIVIEFRQPPKQKSVDLLSLKADLFIVESVFGEDACQHRLLRQLTSDAAYYQAETQTYRYPALTPGRYLIVPHYYSDTAVEAEFLLRIFSQVTIACREVKEDSGYFITKCARTGFEHNDAMQTTGEVETRHGAWVADQNAGGQPSKKSFYRNPLYRIHIKHPGQLIEQPCSISLCQDVTKMSDLTMGIRLYKKPDNDKAPIPINSYWIREGHDECPTNTEGKQSRFITDSDASVNYMLMPGDYYVVVYTSQPDQEGSYILQIATKYKTNIMEYNIAELPK